VLPGDIDTLAIQPDQEVFPAQPRGRHPHQQLPTRKSQPPGLDRPEPRIQPVDQPQPLDQLRHRDHPRHRGQIRVRRADPHLPAAPADIP
jgi:hypothetical protein